jgi:hypothetical protein
MLNRDPSLQHVTDSIAKQPEKNNEGMNQMTKFEKILSVENEYFVIRHWTTNFREEPWP